MPSSNRSWRTRKPRDRLASVEPGPLEPGHLARHPRSVAVGDGGFEPGEGARPLRLGRRVAQIDEDLAVSFGDRVGAHRIAADERRAAGEIELPVVPIAGQDATRSERALAQRIALMRAAVGDRENAVALGQQQHLPALLSHQPAALGFEIGAADAGCAEHGPSLCRWADPAQVSSNSGARPQPLPACRCRPAASRP
jgi:hypothetical protein